MSEKGVGVNSVLCTEYGKWVHKRSFASQNILHAQNYDYVCPSCEQPDGGDGVEQEHISLEPGSENVVEEMEILTYLDDVMCLTRM